MAYTDTQKAAIKKVLVEYKRKVRTIVSKHKKEIAQAVGDLDKQKADKIKKLIDTF